MNSRVPNISIVLNKGIFEKVGITVNLGILVGFILQESVSDLYVLLCMYFQLRSKQEFYQYKIAKSYLLLNSEYMR